MKIISLLLSLILLFSLCGCDSDSEDFKITPLPIPSVPEEEPETQPTLPCPTIPAEPEETETTEPTEPAPPPADADFVKICDYIPDAVIDLRYATEDNFTGWVIYDFTDAWLRYGTVKKLMAVQSELRENGYCLKIWDSFRPVSAQFRLWEIYPDSTYVANPNTGYSSHSRGNTIDITIVRLDGSDVVMPTGFDDFSRLADRDYSDCTAEAAENAIFLETLMEKHGFKGYYGEWWHYTDTVSYPVEKSEIQNGGE